MKPIVKTNKKNIIDIKPRRPRFPKVIAHGNKNVTSRSKIMNNKVTR
jgi:hypothetical protein